MDGLVSATADTPGYSIGVFIGHGKVIWRTFQTDLSSTFSSLKDKESRKNTISVVEGVNYPFLKVSQK